MRIFLDTEFLEDGKTIDLISIGMVREDGQELHLGNIDADWNRIYKDAWLMENVVPKLPHISDRSFWKTRTDIQQRVSEFCNTIITGESFKLVGESFVPEFWAYYADYDWVVFCQLFGRMIDLPKNWPKYCNDFKQYIKMFGFETEHQSEEVAHNALEDAKWLRDEFKRLYFDAELMQKDIFDERNVK